MEVVRYLVDLEDTDLLPVNDKGKTPGFAARSKKHHAIADLIAERVKAMFPNVDPEPRPPKGTSKVCVCM
jgi:hypothetical protein